MEKTDNDKSYDIIIPSFMQPNLKTSRIFFLIDAAFTLTVKASIVLKQKNN